MRTERLANEMKGFESERKERERLEGESKERENERKEKENERKDKNKIDWISIFKYFAGAVSITTAIAIAYILYKQWEAQRESLSD